MWALGLYCIQEVRKSRKERSLWAAAEELKGRVVRPARYSPNENDYHSLQISHLDSEYHFPVVYKFFQISKAKMKKCFLSQKF